MSIKIGVMGCASIAKKSVIPAILASKEEFELRAIASRTIDNANSFTLQFGGDPLGSYQALLERTDVKAIYMPLPTGLHEEWAIKALEAGKHLLIEKSLAYNYESAKRITQLAKEKKLVVMENFMFWYHSQQQEIMNRLHKGDIGEIRGIRASFGFPPLPKGNFRYEPETGGGVVFDAAAYTLKVSQMILGLEVKVAAGSLIYDPVMNVDLYGGALVVAPNGLTSQISFGFDNYYQCNLEVWGSKGKLYADRIFTAQPGYQPKIVIEKQDYKEEQTLKADNHFIKILAAFSENIEKGNFEKCADEVLNQARLIEELKTVSTKAFAEKPLF